MGTMTKVVSVQVKALGDRQVETIASTANLDRENDRILASAWQLDNYKRTGAPVLWGHDYGAPPVARSVDVRVVGGALRTLDEFPPRGIYPLADTVHDLVKAGFINSKSVGFRPLKWRPNDEGGRDYTDVELLENSYVSVAANPEALVVARSKGLDRVRLDAFLRSPRESGMDLATFRLEWARTPANAVVLVLDDESPRAFVGRDGRRADGKRYDARTGEWVQL